MVHALEEIQRLLKPDGCLIEIHPVANASRINVYDGSHILFADSYPPSDGEDVRQAEAALDEVVQRRLFFIERSGEFDLTTFASSVTELRECFAKLEAYDDGPKDEALEAQRTTQYARVDEIMQAAGDGAEVAFHERARITRLNPNVIK